MNIGFVSYWCDRGAAYVTKQYMELLEEGNNLFVYARGAEYCQGNPKWDKPYVHWGWPMPNGISDILWSDFKRWIKKNKIQLIFFNEQREFNVIVKLRREFPDIVIGSYIDYYTMSLVKKFDLFDFLICNTKRHYSVFDWHPNCHYVPWGTDVELFNTDKYEPSDCVRFYHSAGMAARKGTDVLIDTFLNTDLCQKSKLILHVQAENRLNLGHSDEELLAKNIVVVRKTVTLPGLYYMGDVYVYPTVLDGLGLTMYEALSSGMPVVTTDEPPMSEVVNDEVGKLIRVEKKLARDDGYYWPNSYVDKKDLYEKMMYYVEHADQIQEMRQKAREYAVEKLDWAARKDEVNEIFNNAKPRSYSDETLDSFIVHKSFGTRVDYGIHFCIQIVAHIWTAYKKVFRIKRK